MITSPTSPVRTCTPDVSCRKDLTVLTSTGDEKKGKTFVYKSITKSVKYVFRRYFTIIMNKYLIRGIYFPIFFETIKNLLFSKWKKHRLENSVYKRLLPSITLDSLSKTQHWEVKKFSRQYNRTKTKITVNHNRFDMTLSFSTVIWIESTKWHDNINDYEYFRFLTFKFLYGRHDYFAPTSRWSLLTFIFTIYIIKSLIQSLTIDICYIYTNQTTPNIKLRRYIYK